DGGRRAPVPHQPRRAPAPPRPGRRVADPRVPRPAPPRRAQQRAHRELGRRRVGRRARPALRAPRRRPPHRPPLTLWDSGSAGRWCGTAGADASSPVPREGPGSTTGRRVRTRATSLLVATLVTRLAKQLAVLLLGHALAALLDDGAHTVLAILERRVGRRPVDRPRVVHG